MWYIHSITKINFIEQHILPSAEFILVDGPKKQPAKGWLPCHYANVAYELVLKNGRIMELVDMRVDKKKTSKRNVVVQTIKKINTRKKFAPREYSARAYEQQADKAYASPALWTCATLYSHWELRRMNIRHVFESLVKDIENIVRPHSPAYRPRFMYRIERTKGLIERALRQMGKTPYDDWSGFEARLEWQQQHNTAKREKPSEHIRGLQKYQDLWTTTPLIQEAKTIATAFRPDNVTLVIGSPSPEVVPKDAVVLVRNVEDAYRWKCEVDWGTLCVFALTFDPARRVELGVADVAQMETGRAVYMPWAHLWGQDDWLQLIERKPEHVTCIGRLDQWPNGRGQIFRDMLQSEKFETVRGYHAAVEHVEMVQTDNLAAFVESIRAKHKVVQCFADQKYTEIDCGRRYLKRPRRTRTMRPIEDTDLPAMCQPLYEEKRIHAPDEFAGNASVQNVRFYHGLKVSAVIFICSEKTTPFEVHVARTYCRDALYVVNCTTCLFSMRKVAPNRITINPFI